MFRLMQISTWLASGNHYSASCRWQLFLFAHSEVADAVHLTFRTIDPVYLTFHLMTNYIRLATIKLACQLDNTWCWRFNGPTNLQYTLIICQLRLSNCLLTWQLHDNTSAKCTATCSMSWYSFSARPQRHNYNGFMLCSLTVLIT